MVAVRGANDGLTHLALLAITTQPPQADRIALEVHEVECRRAGLSDRKRCWIVVDEYNYDVAERSWYIGPDEQALGPASASRYSCADRWHGHRGRVKMQARKAAPFRLTTTCPRHSGRSLHLSTRLDKLAFLEKCAHISH
nr:hypothetical protein [Sinorhizobium meliloti]